MAGALSAAYMSCNSNPSEWFNDSGASQHMTPCADLLINKKPTSVSEIMTANATKVPVCGAGDVNVNVMSHEVDIKNVLCVPSLSANLLSVAEMIKNGNEIVFNKNGCSVFNSEKKCVANVTPEDGVYKLKMEPKKCYSAEVSRRNVSAI